MDCRKGKDFNLSSKRKMSELIYVYLIIVKLFSLALFILAKEPVHAASDQTFIIVHS